MTKQEKVQLENWLIECYGRAQYFADVLDPKREWKRPAAFLDSIVNQVSECYSEVFGCSIMEARKQRIAS